MLGVFEIFVRSGHRRLWGLTVHDPEKWEPVFG